MNEVQQERVNALELISKQIGGAYSPEQIGVIQKSVAKNTTAVELAYFLSVCNSVGLNPFNKEVWCYKDHKGNLIIFTGRDGLLRKAQEQPLFNGIRSAEVCEKDQFSMDLPNAKVNHIHGMSDRGKVIGAYCMVFRKGGEPTIEWVSMDDFRPAHANGYSPWVKFPAAMIKKVAESHALKKAFGFTGVQIEYDYEIIGDKAIPKGARPEKVDKDKEHVKSFIDNAVNGTELAQVPQEKLDKHPDLQELYDTRMEDFMTQETEADEV